MFRPEMNPSEMLLGRGKEIEYQAFRRSRFDGSPTKSSFDFDAKEVLWEQRAHIISSDECDHELARE